MLANKFKACCNAQIDNDKNVRITQAMSLRSKYHKSIWNCAQQVSIYCFYIDMCTSFFLHTIPDTFQSFIRPTQPYCLSALMNLSYVFKVNNNAKYTVSQDFMQVLHKICLSGPVGPTILEKYDKCVIW